jgi:hypothetical protein
MKRAAELHEELLFRQPPKEEDCPICFLVLPKADGMVGVEKLLWLAAGKLFVADVCVNTKYNLISNLCVHFVDLPVLKMGKKYLS